jgi:hypothetical protein
MTNLFTVEVRAGREVLRAYACATAGEAILAARVLHEPYGEHVVAYNAAGETVAEHLARRNAYCPRFSDACPDCGEPLSGGACSMSCGGRSGE